MLLSYAFIEVYHDHCIPKIPQRIGFCYEPPPPSSIYKMVPITFIVLTNKTLHAIIICCACLYSCMCVFRCVLSGNSCLGLLEFDNPAVGDWIVYQSTYRETKGDLKVGPREFTSILPSVHICQDFQHKLL